MLGYPLKITLERKYCRSLGKEKFQQRNYSESKACIVEQFTGHFSFIGF